MRTVVIAGGAGFIGLHLAESFLKDGYRVEVIDNEWTGSGEAVVKLSKNFPGQVAYNRGDIRFPNVVGFESPEVIFNLACPASPFHYQRDRLYTLRTCTEGTYNLMMSAKNRGCKFVHASTSEIYGDPEVHPQPEEYVGHVHTIGPRACYDEGKRAAETICSDGAKDLGIDVRMVRIFNTYGPGMLNADGRVVAAFVDWALKHEPIQVFGDGSQSRSFCYVSDLVKGLRAYADLEDPEWGLMNLGNPAEFDINELAHAVIEETNSRSTVEYGPLPTHDPTVRRPVVDRAVKMIGWDPEVDLREGIRRTAEWMRSL
jgi:UDP-glucuronate decarboxylase